MSGMDKDVSREFGEERKYQREHPVQYFFCGYRLGEKWRNLIFGREMNRLMKENEALKLNEILLRDKVRDYKTLAELNATRVDELKKENKQLSEQLSIAQYESNQMPVTTDCFIRQAYEKVILDIKAKALLPSILFLEYRNKNHGTVLKKVELKSVETVGCSLAVRLPDTSVEFQNGHRFKFESCHLKQRQFIMETFLFYDADYNQDWRLWKQRPTIEEMNIVPWGNKEN